MTDALSAAVFVDRDGTIIEDRDYCSDPKDVKIFPGATDALRCFGEVIATSAPQSKAASAISILSVATMRASSFLVSWQRSHTWRKSGLPAMEYSGFPGKRVEPQRAGIMPSALPIGSDGKSRRYRDHHCWAKMICAAADKSSATQSALLSHVSR